MYKNTSRQIKTRYTLQSDFDYTVPDHVDMMQGPLSNEAFWRGLDLSGVITSSIQSLARKKKLDPRTDGVSVHVTNWDTKTRIAKLTASQVHNKVMSVAPVDVGGF